MGRIGEVICRTWQTADKMKRFRGRLAEEKVKVTIFTLYRSHYTIFTLYRSHYTDIIVKQSSKLWTLFLSVR